MLKILDSILGAIATWILIKLNITFMLISLLAGYKVFYLHWFFCKIIKMALQKYIFGEVTI